MNTYKLVYSDGQFVKSVQDEKKPALFTREQASNKMHELSDSCFIVPADYVYTFNLGAGKTWATPGQRG